MNTKVESSRSSEDTTEKWTDLAETWVAVEKKLEGNRELKKIYEDVKKEHMMELMGRTSGNETSTDNYDKISKFIEKYAPIGDIIKSVDDRHHHGQLGFGIFTLLWLMTGATTSYTIYMTDQLKLMSKRVQDIFLYESLWRGRIDDGRMRSLIDNVYKAFVLFVAECYKHYSSSPIGRVWRSVVLTRNILKDKTKVFDNAVRDVLEYSKILQENIRSDQKEKDLRADQDRIVSRIATQFVKPHGSCQNSDPEKYIGSIQRNEEPSYEQDDPYAPETGEVSTLYRAEKFKWWHDCPDCVMLLLKAQNFRGTEPWEPLWISDAIAKYTCDLKTAANHSGVIFRAANPEEDISVFMASIITSLLKWNQRFFEDHAQHNTKLTELLDIIGQRNHEIEDKAKALLEPMKSLLRTWLQHFSGSTITIIACDFHNYAEHWSDRERRPPSALVDFIDALLQVMTQVESAEGRLRVCLVVKSHAWPETLQDKIKGQCGQHISRLERVLRVEEMVQGQRGFIS